MKKRILILSLLMLGISAITAADLRLIHVKGIHSIGARVGTALFNTWNVGVNYNYCLHRRWVLNTGVDYEQGKFATIDINYDDANRTITIGERKGEFDGMLRNRRFNIILVTKEMPLGIDDVNPKGKIVKYNGSKKTIRL